MIVSDLNQVREYIVTVKEGVDWRELHNELIRDTASDDSVDSNIVPDRKCHCCKERAINPRNTHYHLSENEARKLRRDPRVVGVTAIDDMAEISPYAVQDGNFNRNSTSSGTHDNWGLLRHISETNTFANSSADPGGTYDYVLDGTGVDVVILDTGIQVGHPEWEDANGVSRLKLVDWPTISGLSFTQPANFYTDTNGHGTHCAGTMAGKTFGWAKNADIYCITLYGNTGNNIVWADAVDAMISWHTKKNNPSDPAYTGRPTVVNMSFGYSQYIWSGTPNQFSFSSTSTRYNITGGRVRGVSHSDTSNLTQYGVPAFFGGYCTIGVKYTTIDADIRSLVNAGIHVCIASGNDSQKIDVPGGVDYNNYFSILNSSNWIYYHRGGSPSPFEAGETYWFTGDGNGDLSSGTITDAHNVGALDVSDAIDGGFKDKKVLFSNSGPGVNIYSAGTYIMSARPTNGFSTPYFANASYRQQKISGTSMATPQIVGMTACLLQAHPDWTPAQAKKWLESNAKANMYTTGRDNDYAVTDTIHGGPNRVAYFPLSGQRKFNHASGTLASYSLTANTSSVDESFEGGQVTYTLNTTGLPDGTVVTGRFDTVADGYNVDNLVDLGDSLPFFVNFFVSNNTATEVYFFGPDSQPDGVGRPTGVYPFNETVSYPITDRTYSVAPKVIDSITFSMLAGDPSSLDLNSVEMQRWTLSQYSCTINGLGQIDNIKMDVANPYPEVSESFHVQNNENLMVALPASTDITDKQSIVNALASVYDWSTGTFTDSNYGEISARVSGTKEPGAELARLRLNEVILPGSSEAIDIKNQNITVDVTVNDTSVVTTFDYYYVYMSAGPYTEGNSITFTIKGYNTPPTNSLTWSVIGLGSSNVTAGDFVENTVSGSVTLQNGTATVTLTPAQDLATEGAEFMVFEVRGTGEWTSLTANQYFTVEANAT